MPEMPGQLNGNGNGNGAAASRVPLFSQVVLRSQSDPRLMQLASNGNEAAIDVLLQRYRKPLLQYCSRLVDPARAEDIVQQTFEKAIAQLRGSNRILHIKPWLYRVVHNDAIDLMRQTARFYPLDDQSESRLGSPEQLEGRQQLRTAIKEIDQLPPRQRTALLLREMEGRSFEEIASELDSSVEGVYQLLRRARQHLREKAAALVPLPIVRWATSLGSHGTAAERAGEVAVGAGGVAGIVKVAGVALTVGAIAVGAASLDGQGTNFAAPGGSGSRQVATAPPSAAGASPTTITSSGGASQPQANSAPSTQTPAGNDGSQGGTGGGDTGSGDGTGGGGDGSAPVGAAGGTVGSGVTGAGATSAAVAAKATVFVAGRTVNVQVESHSGSWSVNRVDGGYTVRDEQGGGVTAPPDSGCVSTAVNEASCQVPGAKTTAYIWGTEAADDIAVTPDGAGDADAIKVALTSVSALDRYYVDGGPGDDTLYGSGNGDLAGGSGDDQLTAEGGGAHLLLGGTGDDTLTGGEGRETMIGGIGNDTLDGGRGYDIFVGADDQDHDASVDKIEAGDGGKDYILCDTSEGAVTKVATFDSRKEADGDVVSLEDGNCGPEEQTAG